MATTAKAEVTFRNHGIPRILTFAFIWPSCFHLGVLSGSLLHTVLLHEYPFFFVSSPPPHHVCYIACDSRSGRSPISPCHPSSERSLIPLLTICYRASPPFLLSVFIPLFIISRNFGHSFYPFLSTYVTLSSRSAIYFSVAGFFFASMNVLFSCAHCRPSSILARTLSVNGFSW